MQASGQRRVQTGIRLDPDLHERISALATRENRSVANTIEWLLQNALSAMEARSDA